MMPDEPPSVLDRIPAKHNHALRLVTFNVNGIRTVFHYHPWTRLRTLDAMFHALHADIVTLQELKLTPKDVDNSVARIEGYLSFVSVPKVKKGYAGVGVYVRVAKDDEPIAVRRSLKVVRAEEGITGVLISHDTKVRYRDGEGAIGGYPNLDDDVCEQIDSEGRCVVIELATNTVVISVYCPANSMGTEEGEQFRIQFLEALLARIRNLKEMGKEVVLMGDVNIARDLIDRADALSELFKTGLLKRVDEEKFEEVNKAHALNFIRRSIPRLLLNEILLDSIDKTEVSRARVMVDTFRKCQGRKHGMYTVWNTMRNSRPGNFGSRIDLILVTESLSRLTSAAGIWPFLMGSDHCPAYADFDISGFTGDIPTTGLPKLEARFVYKLSSGSIHSMFAMAKKRPASETSPSPPTQVMVKKPVPTDLTKNDAKKRKKVATPSVMSFFKSKSTTPVPSQPDEDGVVIIDDETSVVQDTPIASQPSTESSQSSSVKLCNGRFFLSSEKIPTCNHKEPCILKTARTSENKGRKFWTCGKDAGEIACPEDAKKYSCGFFKWK